MIVTAKMKFSNFTLSFVEFLLNIYTLINNNSMDQVSEEQQSQSKTTVTLLDEYCRYYSDFSKMFSNCKRK